MISECFFVLCMFVDYLLYFKYVWDIVSFFFWIIFEMNEDIVFLVYNKRVFKRFFVFFDGKILVVFIRKENDML